MMKTGSQTARLSIKQSQGHTNFMAQEIKGDQFENVEIGSSDSGEYE